MQRFYCKSACLAGGRVTEDQGDVKFDGRIGYGRGLGENGVGRGI
jgi:hypothetical protein